MKKTDGEYQTEQRMAAKLKAIPLPDFENKTVLDVGCDHGHWCWLAAERGAAHVVGLDRNREARGTPIDLIARNREIAASECQPCSFEHIDLGRQWREFGKFDVVLCFSMYHHFFENCGDHDAVWFWLWRHCKTELLWENPVDINDAVVRRNVSPDNQKNYTRDKILAAAEKYFTVERVGPALHEPFREVWRCRPKQLPIETFTGKTETGVGGATTAFNYSGGRRRKLVHDILGVEVLPGSLNVRLRSHFDWNSGYFRAKVLDPVDRKDLTSDWKPRWARFYPVRANDIPCFAFRFEGERYIETFVELISDRRLRDAIGDEVKLCR